MPEADHYATLGLDRRCSIDQVRTAYRILSKRHHPDVNREDPGATESSMALNLAYEVLSDPARRRAYDHELASESGRSRPRQSTRLERNLSQDVLLRLDELFRGTTLQIRVNDPANSEGPELLELVVPPNTPPGARFRVAREGTFAGGTVTVRVKLQPNARFKARGSDLVAELRISAQRAEQGGVETAAGPCGTTLRVTIPPRIGRGETIRIPGEGLPKPRGGRGDLLLKVRYRPEVRISRSSFR